MSQVDRLKSTGAVVRKAKCVVDLAKEKEGDEEKEDESEEEAESHEETRAEEAESPEHAQSTGVAQRPARTSKRAVTTRTRRSHKQRRAPGVHAWPQPLRWHLKRVGPLPCRWGAWAFVLEAAAWPSGTKPRRTPTPPERHEADAYQVPRSCPTSGVVEAPSIVKASSHWGMISSATPSFDRAS